MKERSNLSLKRESKRTSVETEQFKNKLCFLLENAKPEVAYRIKCDLAIQNDMPFYNDRPKRIKGKRIPSREYLREILFFLIQCEDKDFVKILLKKLSVNQGQIIRKLAPRIGQRKDIWEHAIPAKVIVIELFEMVLKDDLTELDKLLDVYASAGQRGLSKEQDLLLKEYKASMPEEWDWRKSDVDPLARHNKLGIFH